MDKKEFIAKTNPKYSIISVGKNNSYGHPNKDVLNNLDNSKLYRTDMSRNNYENLAKFLRSNNSKWKKKSIESCDSKCILTGSKNFNIHHIVNVSTIIKITLDNLNIDYKNFEDYSEKELNLILNEFLKVQDEYSIGVCLREDLHILYHSLYGQQNNNVEQFNNFIKEYKNGTFDKYIENKSFTKCVETAGNM